MPADDYKMKPNLINLEVFTLNNIIVVNCINKFSKLKTQCTRVIKRI